MFDAVVALERAEIDAVTSPCWRYNHWVRLSRMVRDIPADTSTDLDVREIDRGSAGIFGEIVTAACGYPPGVAPLPGQTVGRPGWRHLAYAGDTPIASAAMYVSGDRLVRIRRDRCGAQKARGSACACRTSPA